MHKTSLRARLILSFAVLAFMVPGCTVVVRGPAVPAREPVRAGVLRGIFHVHSNHSHDSRASLKLIMEIARQADLDFVVVTDHNNRNGSQEYQKLGSPKPPLLIFGNEISTWHDGHLTGLGITRELPDVEDVREIVKAIHDQGGYAIPAHPFSPRKPWMNWNIQNFDGVEIFCFSDVFYSRLGFDLISKAFFLTPKAFLESVLTRPDATLKLWDERLNLGNRLAAFGAADAHLKVNLGNLYLENLLLYFQAVTMYVAADELDEQKIVEALAHGRSFIAFEVRGIAQDFSFSAGEGDQTYGAGDSLKADSEAVLTIKSPEEAEIHLIHNGELIHSVQGKALEWKGLKQGTYRAEVYRNSKIWIVSNPIYVE